MKPYQICKKAGLKNLNELIELTEKSKDTLIYWAKNNPSFFQIVVDGAKRKKEELERIEK